MNQTQIKALLKDNLELVEKLHVVEAKNRELTLRVEQSDSLVDDSFAIGTPLRELPEASLPPDYEEEPKVARALDFWASDKSLKSLKENSLLANEIRELKLEKEALIESVSALKTERSMEQAALIAEIASLKDTFNKEIQASQATRTAAESSSRLTIRELTDQITSLTASVKASNMLTSALNEDLAAVKFERDKLWEELSALYRDKDDLSSKFVASRNETLQLNTELAQKMAKMSGLEQELASLRDKQEEKTVDLKTGLELQMMETSRKISELRLANLKLESELKGKATILEEREAQMQSLHEKYKRTEHRSQQRKSRLSRLSRTKEELEAAIRKERGVFRSVTQEMTRTMSELQSPLKPT